MMNNLRRLLSLALLGGLSLSGAARAATPNQQKQFLDLVYERQVTGHPAAIPLDPSMVKAFDDLISRGHTINIALIRSFLGIAPNGTFLPETSLAAKYRQEFVYQLLVDRAAIRPFGGSEAILRTLRGTPAPITEHDNVVRGFATEAAAMNYGIFQLRVNGAFAYKHIQSYIDTSFHPPRTLWQVTIAYLF